MTQTLKLSVPDMSCGHCKAVVEKTIAAQDAGAKVAVDLEARTVSVESTAPAAALIAALAEEGYPAQPA
ncbi:heavy-metal-associated domain-containing protein [Solirhodobacter olei]|uniref:heavy-metal-associated domain-containing protein n=1 Tax=Solirhodobacter olei TaxID=2493082 RepID=UPI000FD9CDFE|nr:heavy-metal-associated domain-containing protein [Solirhodobacter olei]